MSYEDVYDLTNKLQSLDKKEASRQLCSFFVKSRFDDVRFHRHFIDASGDGGIDYFYSSDVQFYIVQSKYNSKNSAASFNNIQTEIDKVIETIEKAHTLISREKLIVTCDGEEIPFLGRLEAMKYASSEHGVREDMQNNGQSMVQNFWLLKKNEFVQIAPLSKAYTRKPLTEKEKRILYQMTPDGIANMIRTSEHVELGRKTIDGVSVEGLEIRSTDMVVAPIEVDSIVIRMWVDVKTYLPVVIEAEAMSSDKGLTALTGGKPGKIELFAGEFQWDVELDPKIFEPNIPDDYTMPEE